MEELKTLISRTLAGDLDAFGEIVRRFQDMAYGYAYSVLGDFHLAEDAAAEAFFQAYRKLSALRDPAAFPGWFRRIVLRYCDRLVRKRRVPTVSLGDAPPPATPQAGPVQMAEQRELQETVLAAIRALPEHQRTATTLFYINGYSVGDIAEFLEAPEGTVKRRLHDARKRLKERMMTMVEDTLKSHRPGPEQRQAVIDELKGRKKYFDQRPWSPSEQWADWWHQRRMKDVCANAARYGIEPDEDLPRMVAEYQAAMTFRDDFKDVPRRWGIPEDVELILMRELCRELAVSPVAIHRWADQSLPVLRYHPWYAYDKAQAMEWVAQQEIGPAERISKAESREPLLVTLRALAAGETTLAEVRAVFAGLQTSTISLVAHLNSAAEVMEVKLDPVWTEPWEAVRPQERLDNAKRYGLSKPSEDWLGVPQNVHNGRIFEIRDLCRRLEISPFEIIRWTRQGMPCVWHSPWMRWDVEHAAEWIAEHDKLPAAKHTADELDVLEDFVLEAVADGTGTPEEARDIFLGWSGLM